MKLKFWIWAHRATEGLWHWIYYNRIPEGIEQVRVAREAQERSYQYLVDFVNSKGKSVPH